MCVPAHARSLWALSAHPVHAPPLPPGSKQIRRCENSRSDGGLTRAPMIALSSADEHLHRYPSNPHALADSNSRNRIVMPPMTTRTADADGSRDRRHHRLLHGAGARRRGPLSPREMAAPERAGRATAGCELGIHDDRFVPGLTRLAAEIHRGGAKASIQLGHGGLATRAAIFAARSPVAPSAIPHAVFEVTQQKRLCRRKSSLRTHPARRLCRSRRPPRERSNAGSIASKSTLRTAI